MPAGAYAQGMAPPNDSQATLSLVLGIVGLACCAGVISPVALFIGSGSRRRIRNSGGTLGGEGMATAGFIMGIIGTVILALWVLAVIADIIGIIASTRGA